jgi:hypothetical protein
MSEASAVSRVPEDLPLDKPSPARIYDYMLGGYHNFEIDRLIAGKVIEIYPDARSSAQACRAFLRRVVAFFVDQGIDQFLDIGAGLPTVGNTHQVAHKTNPSARVVYVDIDPVAVAHSRAMLRDIPNAAALQGDARRSDQILNHPQVRASLDLNQPVAVLLLLLLHAIPDDEEAHGAVHSLCEALAPGSYIAISHGTCDKAPPDVIEQMERLSAATPTPSKYRSHSAIQPFFRGLELIEPGLVYIPLWRPEGPHDIFLNDPERSLTFGGVGRKP